MAQYAGRQSLLWYLLLKIYPVIHLYTKEGTRERVFASSSMGPYKPADWENPRGFNRSDDDHH